MITITKQNDGVLFTFENSDKYLYGNGSILVPFNSLSIIADESDMITLKKAAANDVFLSARYDTDLGYRSKDDAIDDLKGMLFAETGGGGSESGITSGEVQTMIDNSLEDYYTDDEVDAALSGKASVSDVTAVANDVQTVSGQVATKVATSDFNTYSAATDSRLAEDEEVTAAALNDLQENKADTSAVTTVSDALTAHTANTSVHVTSADKTAWNNKSDFSGDYNDLTNKPTIPTVPTNISDFTNDAGYITNADIAGKADTSAVTAVQQSLSGKQDTLVSGTNIKTINNESILGSGNITISGGGGQSLVYYTEDTSKESATIMVQNDDDLNRSENRVFVGGDILIESYNETDDGEGNAGTTDTQVDINSLGLSIITSSDDGIDTTQTELKVQPMGAYVNSEPIATEPYVDAAISGKVDTSAVTAVNDALTAHTANTTVHVTSVEKDAWNAKANIDHVTQAEYSAMEQAGTLDSNTMYIIDDAVPFDPSTKVDTSAITTSITSGSTDSEIPTAKATYDAIQAGGGGGATYSAGTNISIDTANTINCTLPISKTGDDSVVIGKGNYMSIGSNVQSSVIAGNSVTAATGSHYSLAVGNNLHISNPQETSTGSWNKTSNSSGTFGKSGNTLVSFGNGRNQNSMHNAFEIRQNGDIYFPDTDNTTYPNYYQKPMVRLQDMYGALGGLKFVKLTQAEYDALATKDANTLYIISNVVS